MEKDTIFNVRVRDAGEAQFETILKFGERLNPAEFVAEAAHAMSVLADGFSRAVAISGETPESDKDETLKILRNIYLMARDFVACQYETPEDMLLYKLGQLADEGWRIKFTVRADGSFDYYSLSKQDMLPVVIPAGRRQMIDSAINRRLMLAQNEEEEKLIVGIRDLILSESPE